VFSPDSPRRSKPNDDVRVRASVESISRLDDAVDRKAMLQPAIQPTRERPNAMNTPSLQHQRHTGAGGFVGSAAIEDDFSVARNFVVSLVEFLEAHDLGPTDLAGIHFDFDRGSQIVNRHLLILGE
jgi:hypothetical protein